jgi:hypothetical protein
MQCPILKKAINPYAMKSASSNLHNKDRVNPYRFHRARILN